MNKKAVITALAFTLLLTPGSVPAAAQNTLPSVVSVGDGDTLRVRSQGKTITVRLGCIDAPEIAQKPWGEQSRNRLRQLLPQGTSVQMREISLDRYGRTVAEVFLGNQSVNLQLVNEGQAVVYRQYLSGCATTKNQYLQAEAQAKQKKLGFWNQSNPVMPWEFRRGQGAGKKPSKPPKPSPTPKTSNLPACVNSDCNCTDFTTQAEARRVLNAFPGDPHGLDRDRDGIPCENLR
jgi:micrococcal nuclease